MSLIASDRITPPVFFFGDASSRERTFMVAGGFAVSSKRVAEIDATVKALRDEAGIASEFHWADYRGGKREAAYKGLVDYAFRLIAERHAALHVIVARFEGYNHKQHEGENRDTSINRMYYQLLLHVVAKRYGSKRAIHVRLDAGNDSTDICDMRNELCADAFHKHRTSPNCVRTIEGMSSQSSGVIQMADVIMGAAAAKRNDVAYTSAKGELADYVLARSGLASWSANTPPHARSVTVWQHKTMK